MLVQSNCSSFRSYWLNLYCTSTTIVKVNRKQCKLIEPEKNLVVLKWETGHLSNEKKERRLKKKCSVWQGRAWYDMTWHDMTWHDILKREGAYLEGEGRLITKRWNIVIVRRWRIQSQIFIDGNRAFVPPDDFSSYVAVIHVHCNGCRGRWRVGLSRNR